MFEALNNNGRIALYVQSKGGYRGVGRIEMEKLVQKDISHIGRKMSYKIV